MKIFRMFFICVTFVCIFICISVIFSIFNQQKSYRPTHVITPALGYDKQLVNDNLTFYGRPIAFKIHKST